ncbi:predicted protein [Sclerotinia sclerotiorum 1980 UF-70]|uniref:Uncharacterized protein n=2 Tax=Sclerotinia sclerotiorum (strain ATCC 18683 / 1980 / Ss-1) TaxID=665079 RepID=A7EFU9_SCLS1|nr:predicted protein [Sclerotinia sclerotiorum 1980 UF-70]APA07102.1 hypothetical protein sscle_02g018720 [Sclerotinia sclerotiorum 1980 UF-70]EDO01715.1 predicted protein [Sclerotinia sclerotiorum 1980 UF-70]
MAKKKSSKKAASKARECCHEKKESPSDRRGINEEFTIIGDADIQNALSNLTLQSGVPVADSSNHATSQAESSQSSSNTANKMGVQENNPTAASPGATEAKQNPNHSTRSQTKQKEKENPKTHPHEETTPEFLNALNALIAIKLQSEIQTRLENSIKELNEVIKVTTDANIPTFNFQGTPTSRSSVQQLEKEFHLDELRVICREYKEASEKSIAEIHRRNQEVLLKFGKWRNERIMQGVFVVVD